jgi:hypothetical protein
MAVVVEQSSANAVAGSFTQNTDSFPDDVTVVDFSLEEVRRVTGGTIGIVHEHSDLEPILMTTTATVAISFPSFSLLDNGFWGSGRMGYIGLEGLQNLPPDLVASVEFEFAGGPVSAVGALMNYSIDSPNTIPEGGETMIAAVNADGEILDVFNIPQLAPISTLRQLDAGEFRGIVRNSNDIAAVRFFNSFLVLDDLTFGRIVVPEPAGSTLIMAALVGWSCVRRRQL